MKIGPVSGDLVIELVLVVAAGLALFYIGRKLSDSVKRAGQSIVDAPGLMYDATAEAIDKALSTVGDSKKGVLNGGTPDITLDSMTLGF